MANNGSQTAKFPAIFISHGMPLMALAESPTHFFLKELGKKLGRPEAIVCISAHWETVIPMLSGPANPETIHDFHGFPRPLYEIRYPSPGAPDLAQKIDDLFSESKIESRIDPERGLDHGAWVPLYLMYPQADIPVVQLSVQGDASPESHFRLGEILSPLRDQGVLIMGSGGATHNLEIIHGRKMDEDPEPFAVEFDTWLEKQIAGGNTDAILDWKKSAPEPEKNHPYPSEHFLPIFAPLGAAGRGAKGKLLHRDFIYGILSLASYAWK